MFKTLFLILFFFLFSFFFFPHAVLAGSCDSPHVCSYNWSGSADPTPGADCNTDPQHYTFGTSTVCFGAKTPCVPKCGPWGSGFCCDPKPGFTATPTPGGGILNIPTPPCNTRDSKGGCSQYTTAIGPIQTDVIGLTRNVFSILLSLSGGVALLLIIAAGFQMATSQGNPEKVKEARERLIAAIVGLLFIIFSVLILRIIGVDILHLPGLTG